MKFASDADRCDADSAKSNCLLASFFGADANRILDGTDKNFSVPDLARLGGLDDRIHGWRDLAICDDNFDLYFR